ncbi:MAG: hypothetical protein ACRDRX_27165 [Pseudonocardiaceae bacterium]
MTALEHLNTAANPSSYESVWGVLHRQRWINVTIESMNRALHYDTGYDRIAGVTGQPMERVVERGLL